MSDRKLSERNHTTVWSKCLQLIKDNVTPQSFKTWFEPIKPLKLDGHVLTIEVPSQFFYEWLEEHYIGLLKKTIKQQLGRDGKLEYSILMENAFNNATPYSVKIPARNSHNLRNAPVSVPASDVPVSIKNPFIIPGLRKMNIDSQ
ncbi:MAG TPA: DnaA N-terminal domain-containing protein, partial [Bacteroidia bacterium]|nr:DnaA N-terminal domain-containing protein [Bacteroidia bacterium]